MSADLKEMIMTLAGKKIRTEQKFLKELSIHLLIRQFFSVVYSNKESSKLLKILNSEMYSRTQIYAL